jgi:hypothetical protein
VGYHSTIRNPEVPAVPDMHARPTPEIPYGTPVEIIKIEPLARRLVVDVL